MGETANGNHAEKSPADAVPKADAAVTKVEVPGDAEGKEIDFKKISIEEAFRVLKATEGGLTEVEVKERIAEYGANKLPDSTQNPYLKFLGYLWNPLSWAMEVAAILAIILLDYADFALIVALLLLNATISFVEESNADKAIKALTAALAPKAKAKRDGKWVNIDAADLVPGDLIVINFGNIVPADIKLLGVHGEEDQPLQVDQAALTGESLPAKKFTGDVCFSGSTIKQGEKEALVYATGVNTFFGRAATLIAGTHNVANVQKVMTRIGACCLVTIGLWCLIELVVQFVRTPDPDFADQKHQCFIGVPEGCPTLTNMLVIIVGGIPIAMPTVLAVTLALGAYKLAKEGAIVARMSAVEEMAGMDILCSDKTGTLTLNQLSVDKPTVLIFGDHTLDDVLKFGALSANKVTEEPIDLVLDEAYEGRDNLWDNYKLNKFVPFNPTDKFTIAHVEDKHSGEKIRVMKGAPQVVLRRAFNVDSIKGEVNAKITEFANRGYRALGIGKAPDDGTKVDDAKWEFLCLVPLFDPPRHDTKDTIRMCLEKGISVKMVTGDQLLIGKETARQLGMGTHMYTTELLLAAREGKAEMPREMAHCKDIDELVENADGFAEVFPEHKFEIVKILQGRKHLVGMTGDGVNDAPALKKADVGIAVDGATDAARGAADIVLTRPGLSVIISAVIGARKIFQRMTTYSKYTVAMTFRICFTFGLLTCIYDWYFPTILIVLLAVFNDGAMIALSKDRVVASPVPNTWHLRNIFIIGIVYGLYLTLSSIILFHVAHTSQFFANMGLPDLDTSKSTLDAFCAKLGATDLRQCRVTQAYVRDSILRSVLYSHVSISGQALVFVVRCVGHSFASRAGAFTYIAFFAAQVGSTVIAACGFGGYTPPASGGSAQWSNGDPLYNEISFHGEPSTPSPIYMVKEVPKAGTEGVYTASVVGCGLWIIVTWVWSLIWYFGLDPIKWAMNWILNEEGMRDRVSFKKQRQESRVEKVEEPPTVASSLARTSWQNPMGRVSMQRPNPIMLERASVVMVNDKGTTRAPKDNRNQTFGLT